MPKKKFLILLSALLFSCNTEIEKLTNIIVLLDFSKSIPSQTQLWYRTVVIEDIIPDLGEKDKITVLPIDYGSATSSSELLHADLSTQTFKYMLDSPVIAAKKKKSRKESFLKDIANGFDSTFNYSVNARSQYALGTDVLGGLKQANKYHVKNQNNLIIIFSDMINETEELSLARSMNSQTDINNQLKKITIPNFEKADVIVMTGEQPGLKINQYRLLQKFWGDFFAKTNLKLIDYESGGITILKKRLKEYKSSE